MISKIYILSFFISLSLLDIIKTEDTEEKEEILVTFDISDPDIVLPLEHDVKDFTAKIKTSYRIPETKLSKTGYKFAGWTADGIRGYARGDVLFIEKKEDLAFKPLFVDSSEETKYTVKYYVEIDGEIIDTSESLPPGKYRKNSLVEVDLLIIINDNASQRGWQFDGHEFLGQQKFVMPAKNVVLTPVWHTYHKLTYYAGDVEGILGNDKDEFRLFEGGKKELADGSRFSRIGYKLVGWHCSYDDQDYNFFYTYKMPDADVDFYAIWEPKEYVIVFKVGVSGVANIKIPGKTGTTITVPEIGCDKEGYKFSGWSYQEKVYMPGDDFYIEGADPGIGISLSALWTKIE